MHIKAQLISMHRVRVNVYFFSKCVILLTLGKIDILCLVCTNFCANKIYLRSISDGLWNLSIISVVQKFEQPKHKISIVYSKSTKIIQRKIKAKNTFILALLIRLGMHFVFIGGDGKEHIRIHRI